MLLYHTILGAAVRLGDRVFQLKETDWDDLYNRENLAGFLADAVRSVPVIDAPSQDDLLAPIGAQEVWAAGVTYLRSRTARMDESRQGGGSDFYDRVYQAIRPELFFKATPQRVVGHGGTLHLRSDSRWIVPEPELTLAINRHGRVIGYTIGNDLSCRDIEGENPLYLPQAKVFKNCAAIGPGIWISDGLPSPDTAIVLEILREGREIFRGTTALNRLKRTAEELVEHLFRDNTFPAGCFLMTGTGIVPPDGFCLIPGDEMRITLPPVGTLMNIAG